MDEQEDKVFVPGGSNVEESCGAVVGEVVVSGEERIVDEPVSEGWDVGLGEEGKVANSAGRALCLETEGKSEVRRPLDGVDVIGSSKEVGDAVAGGFVVGGGSGGSSEGEGTKAAVVVEKQSSEEEVVKDGDGPKGQNLETAAAVVEKGESGSSSTFILVEDHNFEAQILEGRHSGNAPEACADFKGEALGHDVASSYETNLLCNDEAVNTHTYAAVEGNTVSMDDEDMTCPNIEGMDTDAYNEKLYFSLEELQETTETTTGITENQHHALADQLLPHQPTQVLVEVLRNSEVDDGIVTKQLLHKSVARKATDSDQVRTSEEHKSAPQLLKVDAANGTVERPSNSSLDFSNLNQSAGVGDKLASVDHNVSNITEKKYTRSSWKQQRAILTSVKDEGAEPQLEADRSSNKNAAHRSFHVESEEARKMKPREQVACPEQVVSEAENLGIQTVCTSSDTTHPLSNVEASPLGLQDSAGGDNEMIIVKDFNRAMKDVPETRSGMEQKLSIDDQTEYAENDDSGEGSEMEVDEHDNEPEDPDSLGEKSGRRTVNSGTFIKGNRAKFKLRPDNKGEFCVSDLVWGKVRSHPWWPGQIFDPSDASERAIKYKKEDCFLVGYFGDRTFGWNEASLLKPFRSRFSLADKQSNTEAFQNAVTCALDEVSRRVELGLSCPCIPAEDRERIKFQIVENTGIRPELSTRECVDNFLGVDLFEAEKLVAYMKTLAQSPAAGADKLDLVIAKSQLLSFYRSKGYSELPKFQCSKNEDGLQLEDEASLQVSVSSFNGSRTSCGQENTSTQKSSCNKRKHDLKDGEYGRKKEKFIHESLTESWDSFDDEVELASPSGKRQKGSESFADDFPDGRNTISRAKVSSAPKPSFKIGECIRRVANQMTGSPSFSKSNSQKLDEGTNGVGDVPDGSLPHSEDLETKAVSTAPEYSSQRDLLAQLFSTAEHPIGSYSVSDIVSFFSDFRNSVVINPDDKDGRSRELAYMGGSSEMFEFEDMSDTYWTDRVIQNGSEEQPPRRGRKRKNQFVPADADKHHQRSNSKKQHLDGYRNVAVDKPSGYVDVNAPAELVMHFPIVDSVPSETNLNRMFRRFGPLKESDTEVDRDTNRARVVFKKCHDAEAAYGSAPKFNIFGQTLVNYHLNYSVSVPFKTPTIATTRGEEDATSFLEYLKA